MRKSISRKTRQRRQGRARKSRIKKLISRTIILAETVLLILIVFVLLGHEQQKAKPVVESAKSEVRQLPVEIKRKLTEAVPSSSFRVPILIYHYVEYITDTKDTIRQSLNINPYIFEEQIRTLFEAGYTFMTMEEIGEVLDGKMNLPQKPIVITFDDGHWDLYTDVFPILQRYHIKATAYIIPGFLGGSDFLTEFQLKSIADSGLIEIGAHTAHHISLREQPEWRLLSEIKDSKTILEKKLHMKVVSFAYPNGAFDEKSIQAVKNNGFITSVSTVPGIEQSNANRYFLYRLRPGIRTGQYLLDWLEREPFSIY